MPGEKLQPISFTKQRVVPYFEHSSNEKITGQTISVRKELISNYDFPSKYWLVFRHALHRPISSRSQLENLSVRLSIIYACRFYK